MPRHPKSTFVLRLLVLVGQAKNFKKRKKRGKNAPTADNGMLRQLHDATPQATSFPAH
jgi:hypothetical protein